MSMDLNLREFAGALDAYSRATKKALPDILNRAGKNVAFRAAQRTKKASASKIQADVKRVVRNHKRGKGGGGNPKVAQEFKKGIKKMVADRVRASGYIRSGWAPAIEKLGGKYRGRKIGKGGASKATVIRLVTEIINNVPGVETMGYDALQWAIDFVTADMIDYADKKLSKIAKAHSP